MPNTSKRITWDDIGKKTYETGVKKGVLYKTDSTGAYTKGVAWNGLSSVDENPTGAESTEIYADDIKYLDIIGVEKFEATIGAYSYPDEFGECDGSKELLPGIFIGQQNRVPFAFSYVTTYGNDVKLNEYGYKLHIIYGAKATPSQKTYNSINENPDAINFSWSIKSTPVPVTVKVDEQELKPTSCIVLDSTKVSKDIMKKIEDILYGTEDTDPKLPLPDEIFTLAGGTAESGTTDSSETGGTSQGGE